MALPDPNQVRTETIEEPGAPVESNVCTNCNDTNKPDNIVCSRCGAILNTPAPQGLRFLIGDTAYYNAGTVDDVNVSWFKVRKITLEEGACAQYQGGNIEMNDEDLFKTPIEVWQAARDELIKHRNSLLTDAGKIGEKLAAYEQTIGQLK